MDPVGLAVGIIGLAGLFSTCLDLAKKIGDYKHFKNDEHALATQFVSYRLRFEKWGKALGLDQAASNLSEDRHEALTDAETLEAVRKILDIIRDILSDQKGSSSQNPANPAVNPSRLLARSLTEPFRIIPGSRREKLVWALKRKGKLEEQVDLFGKLVQHLNHLVPIESITRTATTVDVNQTPDPTAQIDPQPGIDNLAWTTEIRDTLQRLEGKAHAETRRELHAWIVRHPPNEIYEDAIQKRLKDTCGWILERPVFNEWLSLPKDPEGPRLLWINGPAGFGKTILCARIVQHLQKVVKTPVANFFFSSDFESRDDPYEAIRCWTSEVISRSEPAFDYVRMKRETQHESAATRTFILQLFSEIVRIVPGCVFVIDGLDECTWLSKGNNPGLGGSIASFLEKLDQAIANSTTRVLIVSRDEPEIRSGVEEMESTIFEYSVIPEDVDSDTRHYARSIVDKKLSKKSESIKTDISEKMAGRCGGQFLWLKLQEDSLRSWKNQKQLQDTIDKTPSGLDSLYHRNWVRLSQLPVEERDRAFSLLRWAAFALRPLTIAEIAEAVLIDLESEELPVDELPDTIDDDYISSEVMGVCGSLLSIRKSSAELDPGLSTIRLTHFSVKQYFLSHDSSSGDTLQANEKLRSSNERIENITLAQLCLRYIHYEQVWQFEREQDSGQVQGSFRDYAAGYWHRHAHNGSLEDEVINDFIDSLFDADGIIWTSWKQWFDSKERETMEIYVDIGDDDDEKKRRREGFYKSMPHSPIFYASTLNLTQTTLALIEKHQSNLDDKTFRGETALSAACKNSNETIAKALVEAGANISMKDYDGATPLHLAATEGCLSLVQLLLKAGAEPTAVDYKQVASLHHAAHEGHIDITESLIQYGADIEAQDYRGVTPLHQAAIRGNLDVIKLLIRKGAAIETMTDANRQTPLHHAAINGQTESAKLFLDYGANINVIDNDMCTPLFDAAFFGFTEVARLLLSRGADMETRGIQDQTALIVAAKNDYPETTQLLLDRGADMNFQDGLGWNALLNACFRGSVDTARVLLKNGIDIASVSRGGYDALSCAAEGGHVEVTRLLLEHGADIATAGSNMRTPLGAAVSKGHYEMVELLLSNGATYDRFLERGWLPLPWASSEGHVKIAELLLDLGAELTEVAIDGLTPLLAATRGNKTEMVRFLLERGADTTTAICDEDGNSPLRNAIFRGNAEMVKLLLDSGADANHQDDQGWRPLGLAAHSGYTDVIQLLLENGGNIAATDGDGWTPLHSAADGGHCNAVDFLLERGANLAALDHTGKTALHIASRGGHHEVVEALLKLSAPSEVTQTDDHQRTPLFYAAMRGHSHVLKLLLSKSTEINAKDYYRSTALFAAVRNGHEEVIGQLLAIGGIPIDSKDIFGETVFYWAQRSGNGQVVGLLKQYMQQNDLQIESDYDSVSVQPHRPFDSQAYWCDVCTRCIPISTEYFECTACNGGDFSACDECVTMGAKCFDKSHTLVVAAEQVDSSSEEEDDWGE